MRYIFYIIEFLISFIEIFWGYKFLGIFFEKNVEDRKRTILEFIYSLILSIFVFLNNQVKLFSNFLLIFVILAISVSGVVLFKTSILRNIIAVGLYYLAITIFDLFSIFILGVFSGNDSIGEILIGEMGIQRCAFIISMKCCLLICYLVLYTLNIDKGIFSRYWWIGVILCLVGYPEPYHTEPCKG